MAAQAKQMQDQTVRPGSALRGIKYSPPLMLLTGLAMNTAIKQQSFWCDEIHHLTILDYQNLDKMLLPRVRHDPFCNFSVFAFWIWNKKRHNSPSRINKYVAK